MSWFSTPVSDPISGSEMGSAAPTGVGERNSTLKRETNNSRDRQRQTESGSGKDVREWIELGEVEIDEKGV